MFPGFQVCCNHNVMQRPCCDLYPAGPTQLAEKTGSKLAAASAVNGLMLACVRVVLVHRLTLGFGRVATVQACSDLVVSIAPQTSEIDTP